jgi:hypothetical protein
MKRAIFATIVLALISTSLSAAPTAIGFSNHQGYGWTAYKTGSNYEMTFNNIVVDTSVPSIPGLVGDAVKLPTMLISNVYLSSGVYNGAIAPLASTDLQINHPGMHWQVGSGSFYATGVIFSAYGFPPQGDLIDLTFGGTSDSLYELLSGQVDEAAGNINGTIMVIPAPAALILAGIGASIVAAFRRRIKC